jgi:DNA replication protein DnaC
VFHDLSEDQGKVLQYITRYEEFREKGMGLYIHSGTKGSGKTMLACCVLNEISSRYYGSVKFVNALDFLEMTKKGFNYDNPEVEALYICKTLVIDDIGAQLDKDWINTVFYRLVNDRYNNHKPTIYTSNLSIDQLKMDDRIIDRIDSTSFEIHLPEKSIRREKRQREKAEIMNKEIGK